MMPFLPLSLPRLQADAQLALFWLHRGEDGLEREKQLLCTDHESRHGRSLAAEDYEEPLTNSNL
jgi:hypothetical protein